MDDVDKKRIEAERNNIEQIVKALLDANYEIAVDYGNDDEEEDYTYEIDLKSIMSKVHQCDEEHLRVRHLSSRSTSFVYLVYGNADDGSEVVCDNGVSLERIIGPVMDKWD